ncbi:MAG: hypothetical protein AAFQ87_16740, partial [Bacteroidota bacterium]
MQRHNINRYLFAFLLASVLLACEKETPTLNEPSHRVIFTSEMDFQNQVQVNGKIAFGDVSAGVASRTWTFPEGADILDSDNDQTSNAETVEVIWTQVGQFEVKLEQTFNSDAYVGTTQQGGTLDTSIVVTVIDSVRASMEAYLINEDGTNGDALILEDGALNEVTASKSVRYIFNGGGEPANVAWDPEGGSATASGSGDFQVDVQYKSLGEYDFAMLASRARPQGADSIKLRNLIKVIPSTEPLFLQAVKERDGKIGLEFGREVNESTINLADFQIEIKNGGNLIMPSIETASLDPNEGNVLLITLAGEQIYNDDSVLVSFTQGNLLSADGVEATTFTDELLVFDKVNLLENTNFDYSFENSPTANWQYLWWGSPWDLYSFEVSTMQAQEGSKSGYIEMDPNGGMILG